MDEQAIIEGRSAIESIIVPGYESNPAIRRLLAQRWKDIPEDKKILIRSARSKCGIQCPICGNLGYYRENCPNGCESPPKTPDSWESTPPQTPPKSPVGLGVLWTPEHCTSYSDDDFIKTNRYDYKKKVDMNVVRPQAQGEQAYLRKNDASIGTFQFFSLAEDSYANSYSQLTLHQVMRRLMRLLEKQLYKNAEDLEASFDTTLLHPPVDKHDRHTFYPVELLKVNEFRDYYLKKESKNHHKKTYKHQGALRCIDDLDPLFRGGNVSDDFLYKPDPQAGAVSVHSKNTWKSILSTSDVLASSDPVLAKKQEKINQIFKEQSKWISLQKKGMTHRNDRYEHLVYIIQAELKLEHQRETILLQATAHAKKEIEMKIFQERLESVDKIMNCLASYNFSSGLEEADFLLFSFERWKHILETKLKPHSIKPGPSKSIRNSSLSHTISSSQSQSHHSQSSSTTVNDVGDSIEELTQDNNSIATKKQNSMKKSSEIVPISSPGSKYNRLISSNNPYLSDQLFLEDLKKKHERNRIAALRPRDLPKPAIPKIIPDDDVGEDIPAYERRKGLYITRNSINTTNIKDNSITSSNSFLSVHTTDDLTSNQSSTEVLAKNKKSRTRDSIALEETIAKVLPFQNLSNDCSDSIDNEQSLDNPSSNSAITTIAAADIIEQQLNQQRSNKKNIIHSKRYNQQREATIPPLSHSDIQSVINEAKKYTNEVVASHEKEEKVKELMNSSKATKRFVPKPRLHPREIDENKAMKAKQAFRRAGLKDHIRKGQDDDLAYLAPTLIPVPGAFQADGSNPMISHTAENLMFKVKKNMILADIGYTPQSMIPLYVRNTLLEKNGTTPGGDQTYDTMSTDRRYTHYMGRPLNRFEPDGDKHALTTMTGLPVNNINKSEKLIKNTLKSSTISFINNKNDNINLINKKLNPDELEKQRKEHKEIKKIIHQEMEKAKDIPISHSLVRMVFKNPLPSLTELKYLDEL